MSDEKRNFKKILIINTFGIGDVLFTTPLLKNLKAHDPDIQIGYVCNRRTESILSEHPLIDQVFVYERDDFVATYRQSKLKFVKKWQSFLKDIQQEKYDCVFDLSLNGNFGFFMKWIGIETRIGFNFKNRNPFLTHKLPFQGYEGKHVIEFYLDLLRSLDIPIQFCEMDLPLSEESVQWADQFLQNHEIQRQETFIVMVPGGGSSWGKESKFKRWSEQNYIKLLNKIIANKDVKITLIGGPDEQDLCARIHKACLDSSLILGGLTSLSQSAALFSKCDLVIANDGGPLHMAVAAGAKTLSIFGPVDENVYGPYPRQGHVTVTDDVKCRPCYRRFRRASCEHVKCLNELDVETVFQKVKEMIL